MFTLAETLEKKRVDRESRYVCGLSRQKGGAPIMLDIESHVFVVLSAQGIRRHVAGGAIS